MRRAVVADDDQFARTLVNDLVSGFGFETAMAASGAQAIALCQTFDPDVAVLDLDFGYGPSGLEVLEAVRRTMPWVAGVILSGHRSPQLVSPQSVLPTSFTRYVVKTDLTDTSVLRDAVEAALADTPELPEGPATGPSVTKTQAHLLRLISLGFSNEEIAAERGCSVRAVENLVSRLYNTLGLTGDNTRNPRVMAAKMYNDGIVWAK